MTDWSVNNGLSNFGAATGHQMNDGRYLFVWDVDTDKGKPGAETMANLVIENKVMPETLTVRTGGGGLHYYLASPTPVPSPSPLLPGIDIRGVGGQVVLPGSVSGKGTYTIEVNAPIADAPEWVLELIRNSGAMTLMTTVPVDESTKNPTPTKTIADVEKAVATVSTDKSGDTFRIVGACWRAGLTLAEARVQVDKRRDLDDHLAGAGDDVARSWSKLAAQAEKSQNEKSPSGDRKLSITWASSITPRKVEWVWEERVPYGELTLTPGRAGIGKSTFHAWMVAKITRGELRGVHYGTPKAALIAATEDSWERTIVPRLMAAGADLTKVGRVDVITSETSLGRLVLPTDCDELAELITENDVVIVSVDPLVSFINSAKLDVYKGTDVRSALEPLKEIAEKTGVAFLGNCHFNKSTGVDALARISNSTAFVEVARAAIGFAQDSEGITVLSQIKNNLGRSAPELASYKYEVHSTKIVTADGPTEVGRFRIVGDSDRTVDEILNESSRTGPKPEARDAAIHWCMSFVRGRAVKPTRAEVIEKGVEAGHAKRTLERALGDDRFIKDRERVGAPTYISVAEEPVMDTSQFDGLLEP